MKAWRRLVLTVFAALVGYTFLQAARLFPRSPGAACAGTLALLIAALASQFSFRWNGESGWLRKAAWAGGAFMGLWAAFVLLSIPLELLWFIPAQERVLAALAAAAAIALAGLAQAVSGPVIRRAVVPIAGLPEALNGLRIVLLSDLHVGPTIRRRYAESVVERSLALGPDLIALAGDLVDGGVPELAAHVEPLRRLKAPLGVFYVTGNHEYYSGALPWVEKMRELGLTVLIDEGRVVERGGAKILVGGVPDAQASYFVPAHKSEPRLAAAQGEGCALKILLAHRPESCVEAEAAGFDLQLSGHTHGGQFFPFRILLPLAERYRKGLHRHGRMWLYVSCGAGYWGPPNRFGVPSEICLLTLEAA